ncbi:MAG: Bro-N domain-containing protein, partial [Synergistaceae bacterium]|nr:Bro-N domain-containing protein [Synergistaceae bacterium]
WFIAKDVCDVLALADVSMTVAKLDDDEKLVQKLFVSGQHRDVITINEPGLYALVLRSNKPEAKAFSRWVRHELLPAIRKTGTYSVETPRMSQEEYELRRDALNLERAKLINSMIEAPSFPMTPETKTVFAHEVFKLASGHEYLAMLPESTEKWYTATEIGEKLGLSANKVGRIANSQGIKAPEGESNEYGRWIFSKSQYSSREVSSFINNEDALEWFREYQMKTA